MDAAQALGPQGLVAEKLDSYEPRAEQMTMAAAVEKALGESRHLLAEAGTGVGKSFAYLLPIIDYSIARRQPVVVSTNTISLQEQLIGKDIPFLRRVIPDEFAACLVKGRANYVCLRRLALAERLQTSLFETEAELKEFWRIQDWARGTTDGTLSDFEHTPPTKVWSHVHSEYDACAGKNCPHGERQCFYQRARRRMYNANVLVVNHHLLCSDLVLHDHDAGFLPEYTVLVIDEGHSLEGVATDHLGLHLSSGQIAYFLNRLYNPRRQKGFLAHLSERSAVEAVAEARREAGELFDALRAWREQHAPANGRMRQPGDFPNRFPEAFSRLAVVLGEMRSRAKTLEEQFEIGAYRNRALDFSVAVATFLEQRLADYVYWMELTRSRRPQVRLECSPVSVAADLKRLLFDDLRSVIVTSATLCVGETEPFGFIRGRLGTYDADELHVGSPFDYESQMKVYVPRGMPDPQETEPFTEAVIREVKRYLKLSDGKAFVLFTSYRLLETVAEAVRPMLDAMGINSFVQGGGLPRTRMIERFREDVRSVIFGTDSFWQGVDVRGASLSNVIITRLPFSVPDHPVTEARLERIRDTGGDPFMSYTVPEAVLRFKQGIGRLIRTRTDTGIVVVLDPRVRTRRYGRLFLESLPTSSIYRDIEPEETR